MKKSIGSIVIIFCIVALGSSLVYAKFNLDCKENINERNGNKTSIKDADWGYKKGRLYLSIGELYQETTTILGTFEIKENTDIVVNYYAPISNKIKIGLQLEGKIIKDFTNEKEKEIIQLQKGTYQIVSIGSGTAYNISIQLSSDNFKNVQFIELEEIGDIDMLRGLDSLPDITDSREQVLEKIFGFIIPQNYTMNEISGDINDDKFTCDFCTSLVDFKDNYIILASLSNKPKTKLIEYQVKANAKCKLLFNDENGYERVIGEGRSFKGTAVLEVTDKASCLRLLNNSDECKATISISVTDQK